MDYRGVFRLLIFTIVSSRETFAFLLPNNGPPLNDRPIIGVLAQETTSGYGDTFISSSYVKFLMMAGARVMPIKLKESSTYYQDVFNKINGLLLPGGSLSLSTSEYSIAGRAMLDLALQANSRGDYFPVFGICLGFQLLTNVVAGSNKLSSTPGLEDISLPVNYTAAAPTSRLLNGMSTDVYQALGRDPIAYHTHRYSIFAEKYTNTVELRDFFNVLSSNVDENGKEFVSMVEAKDPSYPIFGTQWHPEKSSFDWNPARNISHSLDAIKAAQHLANIFVQEARKSQHRFSDVNDEGRAMIQVERLKYFTGGSFGENYYIDYII